MHQNQQAQTANTNAAYLGQPTAPAPYSEVREQMNRLESALKTTREVLNAHVSLISRIRVPSPTAPPVAVKDSKWIAPSTELGSEIFNLAEFAEETANLAIELNQGIHV